MPSIRFRKRKKSLNSTSRPGPYQSYNCVGKPSFISFDKLPLFFKGGGGGKGFFKRIGGGGFSLEKTYFVVSSNPCSSDG
ncbi:hypothetical protein CEXT_192281 [Caerostris extrusa]|uniref:Uncharacterized protein n=1 Tax=Caerostris extrusa TaxID=172846 RepID=A0AAV4W3T1_CAEEX|nr:hypothetical protein CEXT_192281 [Caerostris extrusa]